MCFDTLAKYRALNSEENAAMLSVLIKEFENKIIETLEVEELEGTSRDQVIEPQNNRIVRIGRDP